MIVRNLLRTTVAMTPEGKSKLPVDRILYFVYRFPLFSKTEVSLFHAPFSFARGSAKRWGGQHLLCVDPLSMPIVFHLEGFELDFVEFDTIRKVGLVSGLHPKLLEDGLAPGHLL